jgi:hypothetical protein
VDIVQVHGMRVHVDDARENEIPSGIDDPPGTLCGEICGYGSHLLPTDAHVSARCPCARHHQPSPYEQIKWLCHTNPIRHLISLTGGLAKRPTLLWRRPRSAIASATLKATEVGSSTTMPTSRSMSSA